MTRQEYLEQRQAYREDLQANSRQRNEALDSLNDQYRNELNELNKRKRDAERIVRYTHADNQHEIERKMHELKVQWAAEHPLLETKVVE